MRQVFIFIGFFICSSVLADHGGQGHSYNGRTFHAIVMRIPKDLQKNLGRGRIITTGRSVNFIMAN